MSNLQSSIQHAVENQVATTGSITFTSLLAIAYKFVHSLGIGQDQFEPTVTTMEGMFDKYIAPLNLVPDLLDPSSAIENYLKAGLRKSIRPTIRHLFDDIATS